MSAMRARPGVFCCDEVNSPAVAQHHIKIVCACESASADQPLSL